MGHAGHTASTVMRRAERGNRHGRHPIRCPDQDAGAAACGDPVTATTRRQGANSHASRRARPARPGAGAFVLRGATGRRALPQQRAVLLGPVQEEARQAQRHVSLQRAGQTLLRRRRLLRARSCDPVVAVLRVQDGANRGRLLQAQGRLVQHECAMLLQSDLRRKRAMRRSAVARIAGAGN